MQQRYKVFIYDSPLIIGNDISHFPQNAKILDWNNLDKKAFLTNVLKVQGTSTQSIQARDPKEVINYLIDELKFIEAAGGLVYKNDKVLVIKRLGRTDLPKGKLEKGENIRECAIREVEEECGVDELSITKELLPSYHCYFHKEKWVIKKTYWFEMECTTSKQPKPQTEEDIEWVKWIPIQDLKKTMSDTYPSIANVLEELRR